MSKAQPSRGLSLFEGSLLCLHLAFPGAGSGAASSALPFSRYLQLKLYKPTVLSSELWHPRCQSRAQLSGPARNSSGQQRCQRCHQPATAAGSIPGQLSRLPHPSFTTSALLSASCVLTTNSNRAQILSYSLITFFFLMKRFRKEDWLPLFWREAHLATAASHRAPLHLPALHRE